jgi:hypothetical protein
MKKTEVPTFDELMGPTVEALKRPEGTAPIDELVPEIVRLLDLPEDVAEVPHGTSARTELEYRSAWARTYLRKAGLLENSRSKLNPLGVKGAGEGGIVAVGKPSAYLHRLWYDSILHDAQSLRYLASRVSVDRIVLGSDDSFPPADLDPLASLRAAGFDAAEVRTITEHNPRSLFRL